ncbi:hypothetical protein FB451DRAFT_1184298 [Mycena latifolia]|nr:hypothetical protein FB451DRAFT_1184298 [Mycena latifolia]
MNGMLGNREKSLTSGTPGTTGGCLHQGRGTGGIADTHKYQPEGEGSKCKRLNFQRDRAGGGKKIRGSEPEARAEDRMFSDEEKSAHVSTPPDINRILGPTIRGPRNSVINKVILFGTPLLGCLGNPSV